MRVASFTNGSKNVVAVESNGKWFDTGESGPRSIIEVLLQGSELSKNFYRSDRELSSDYRFTQPYSPHRNVMCLGKNFSAHAEEFAKFNDDAEVVPSAPIIFTKAVSGLCGPNDDILVDSELSQALDYETELAVIIGKPGRNVSASNALDHVAAYSVINDTTARDLQSLHAQWFLGKSLPAASPLGPVFVTPDEFEPRGKKILSTWINGELRQQAPLSDMIVSVEQAIATISRIVSLEVGDVIAMGTPAGVAVSFDPPKYLKDGDKIISEIEGIGRLVNTVRVRDSHW